MAPYRRVLIAHADPLAHAYLRGLVEDHLRSVDTVESDSFDRLSAQLREEPGILLAVVDRDLPGMSSDVELRYLGKEHPGLPLAVLSNTSGQQTPDIPAIDNNIALIPKQLPEASLVEILRQLTEAVDGVPYAPAGSSITGQMPLGYLTSRQYDVLSLLSRGHSNRQISRDLGIAEGTVKVHVNAAFRVLGVHNRVSATVAFRQYSEARQVSR